MAFHDRAVDSPMLLDPTDYDSVSATFNEALAALKNVDVAANTGQCGDDRLKVTEKFPKSIRFRLELLRLLKLEGLDAVNSRIAQFSKNGR